MLRECRDPVFCFTGDVDWAPEPMIDEFIRFFEDEKIPLTPFVTHKSDAVKRRYGGYKKKHVGVHPNFLFDTTHGGNLDEVVANSINLWPESKSFRSHNYVDSLLITQKYYNVGFKYDSNTCLFLQPNINPQNLASGLLRFPVFLEDIIYVDRVGFSEEASLNGRLSTPGLKILNFHPFHFCMNTPSIGHYEKNRDKIYAGRKWGHLAHKGTGIRSLLEGIVELVKEHGFKTAYLEDLYRSFKHRHDDKGLSPFFLKKNTLVKPRTNVSVWSGRTLLSRYNASTSEEKSNIVKNVYNQMDGRNPYATSPDFNLRELEIKFIVDNVRKTCFSNPKIIDVGCGNGLTALRLAQTVSASIIGFDFSKSMIDGARHLKKTFGITADSPAFKIGDARKTGYPNDYFDVAITQRLLLNLPDEETQRSVVEEIHRVLRRGGVFIMVEGTRNGLRRLNAFRVEMGLSAIPDRSEANVSSLKFEEEDVEAFLKKHFEIVEKQYFGMYYLISRVVHPLLIYPEQPRYDAKINEVARIIAEHDPDYGQMSHVVGYVLKAV